MNTASLLLSSFVLSITGLFVFIWSMRKRLLDPAAHVIFAAGEIGHGEEPSASAAQRTALARSTLEAGRTAATPVQYQRELGPASKPIAPAPSYRLCSSVVP